MALTDKQEKFCLAYVETGNATEAYRRAYDAGNMSPAVINVRACELLKNGKIKVRTDELRAPIREKALMTLEEHVENLRQLKEMAAQHGQFAAAITAETNRGKACGHYVDKQDINLNGSLEAVGKIEIVVVEPPIRT